MHSSTMTSRERILSTLKRQGADHVPFSPQIWQGPKQQGPFFWRNQVERADVMLEMGLDPTIDIWMPDPMPHKDVTIKTWRDTSGPEPLLTKEYHTPAGVLRQVVRESEDWVSPDHGLWVPTTFGPETRFEFGMALFDDHAVSRRLEPWVKGREDLEKLRYIMQLPQGYVLDEWFMDCQRAKEIADKRGLLLHARRTIIGDAFQWFCDIPSFCIWMVENPEFVEEFFDIFYEFAEGITRLSIEAGAELIQHRGWYDIPTYFGTRYFDKYLVPRTNKLSMIVHDAGRLHSYLLPEGQGTLADLLRDMKFDCLTAVDPRMLHFGNMAYLHDKLGAKKSFWGGVCNEVTLRSGNPLLIDAEVKEAIETLGASGGLVLSTIPGFATNEAILMMIDSWRKYR